jgi:hypothetical protein
MMTNISRDISDLRQHCLGGDRETGNRSGVLQRRANYLRGIEDAHGYRIAELASGRFVVEASRAGRERTATLGAERCLIQTGLSASSRRQ